MPPKRSLWQGNFLRLTVAYLPETTAERRREDAARRYGLSSDFSCFPFSSPFFKSPIFPFFFLIRVCAVNHDPVIDSGVDAALAKAAILDGP